MLKVVCLPPMKQARAHAVALAQRERQQHERPALGVVGNHDEGPGAFVLADQPLPGAQQIEPLIGRGEVAGLLEGAPDRLGTRRDRATMSTCAMRRAFDRAGASAVRLCIAAAMVIRETCRETKICVIRPVADLCKEMSTKGNDNGREERAAGEREGGILASDDRWLERLRLELAWFTGQAAAAQPRRRRDPALSSACGRGGAARSSRCARARSRRNSSIAPFAR